MAKTIISHCSPTPEIHYFLTIIYLGYGVALAAHTQLTKTLLTTRAEVGSLPGFYWEVNDEAPDLI